MKFGAVPLAEAKGGIVVHAIRQDGIVLKKGAVIGDAEIDALRAAGVSEITVARIEAGDVPEDVAAAEVAAAAAGDGVYVDRAFTGRANLFAEAAGLLLVDKPSVDRLNAADPDITLATLPPFAPVVVGKMIATVKIIPFAVSAAARDRALAAARAEAPLVCVAPYRLRKIGVIST
ncbi:MAG: 4-diphosphocytidyl-2C-methyl-D-erythritol kinase, partial [Rhodoplanes sp.]